MNIAQTIEIDVEKFLKGTETDAEKFAAAFAKLFKKAPSVIQTVDNFVTETAPVISAAVALALPADEPEVAGALAIAETGLGALEASATAAVSGTSVLANLENFSATVPKLLTGLTIKNPVLQAAIVRIVNLVTGEAKVLVPAVEAWVSQVTAATAAQTATA